MEGYQVERELGVGGQAKVYLATQESFGRKVAIKVLLQQYAEDKEFAARFLREAKTVAGLSHQNIIPVYDFGQKDGTYYMVMEYLPGGDLKPRIDQGIKEQDILTICSQILSALHFAHEKGYVHRDVKPENIMFREDGSAVLTDFGIARLASGENQVTLVGQVLGTPKYMSPEQLQGRQLDGRSDMYAIGIMFFQMFSGKVPYENKDFTTLALMHCKDPIPKLPARAQHFQRIFERMVAKEAEKRFKDCGMLSQLFADIVNGKVDPASIDSAQASTLKQKAEFKVPSGEVQKGARMRRPRLPPDITIELNDLDPLLDNQWNARATAIFNKLDGEQRKYVYAQYLQPKGISIDQETKRLVFSGRPGLLDIKDEVTSARLQQIVIKLEQAQDMLRTTRDVMAFADLLESSIGNIDSFDPEENLAYQKEKLKIRQAFLDDLVLITRGGKFEVPANRRGLTEGAIKDFFVQVFLKHQMLGYRFRTMPIAQLQQSPHPFIADKVAHEAMVRQCDVVKTERYLFMIAPVRNFGQNPYSARRFLYEESAMKGKVVYFSGLAIPFSSVSKPKIVEHLVWSMTRIVTLERQISAGVTELVRGMEEAHAKILLPMLQQDIQADGTELERAIKKKLLDYEQTLSVHVLAKMPKAVLELAKTPDDYDFLFFSIRSLIIQLACDVRDFTSQFAAAFSTSAEELDQRMMSYLCMLDKRKDELFSSQAGKNTDPLRDPKMPLKEFEDTLDEFEPEVEALKDKMRQVILKQEEPKSKFQLWMEKTFKLDQKKKKITPEMVQQEIDQTKQKCLVALIRICKRYQSLTVYLEFEGLVDVDETRRRYALPSGQEGISQLPKLISLWENRGAFSFDEVREKMAFNAMKQAKRMEKEADAA